MAKRRRIASDFKTEYLHNNLYLLYGIPVQPFKPEGIYKTKHPPV
jgi:hypothetical protein